MFSVIRYILLDKPLFCRNQKAAWQTKPRLKKVLKELKVKAYCCESIEILRQPRRL